jgi:hypothetical protein
MSPRQAGIGGAPFWVGMACAAAAAVTIGLVVMPDD